MSITPIKVLLCCALLVGGLAFEIQEVKVKQYQTFQNITNVQFDDVQRIYQGHFENQNITLNYTQLIKGNATKLQIIIYFYVGDTGINTKTWVKVSTIYGAHFNLVKGASPNGRAYAFSQQFTLKTDSSKTIRLEINNGNITNIGFGIYLTGYSVSS